MHTSSQYINITKYLLIPAIGLMTLTSCDDEVNMRSGEEIDYINSLRDEGRLVIDIYSGYERNKPISDDQYITYDIPSEGGNITIDYRTYSGLQRAMAFQLSENENLSPYDRLTDFKKQKFGFEVTKTHGIWVFQPAIYEYGTFYVDAEDPMKLVIKASPNTSARTRHLYVEVGWDALEKFGHTDNKGEAAARPSRHQVYSNAIFIQQKGTGQTDESNLYEELISNDRF